MPGERRRSPRSHTVHTHDPRYNVPQFGRGSGPSLMEIRLPKESPPVDAWEVDNIQKTILMQLRGLDPLWRARFSVAEIVKIKDGVQLHIRERNKNPRNIRILYDFGSDTYNVDAYTINRKMEDKKVYEATDIYNDNLIDVLGYAIRAE